LESIQGALLDVLTKISARPDGHALAVVLKSIEKELGSANVVISRDMRRASVNLPNGKLATVRVTTAKPTHRGKAPVFRFKTPTDLQQYDKLYFGGLARDGSAIVYKMVPSEIGRLKTITLESPFVVSRL
jgi:hypothetical protein